MIEIRVVGIPAPQGSHKAFVNNGRAVITHDSKRTRPWRQDVKTAALDVLAGSPALEGPVEVHVAFTLPRPKYHFGSGRNANVLRGNAPTYVEKKPDIDKLVRSTLDALGEAGVWRDDAQVAALTAVKGYATHPHKPGAVITISALALDPEGEAGKGVSADTSVQEALL